MQCLLLVWVTGKQRDCSGAIRATIVRGLQHDLKHGSRLGLVREDLAHTAHKYSSDFQKKMRACVVLIKQESIEDTQSVLSAENQTKAPFVASLVPVAFCQLLVRIIRVGMGKHRMDLKSLADPSFKPQPSSGSMWKVLSKALHPREPF